MIEKARAWLSRPEAQIGTGGRKEIAARVEEDLWSPAADYGRIVALCARRALREEESMSGPTRVELSDRACKGALTVKTADVASLADYYRREFLVLTAEQTGEGLLDDKVSEFFERPTVSHLADVIAFALVLEALG